MYRDCLEERVGDGGTDDAFDPGVKVRDPGIVFENGAAFIEAPESDL
jgi:hypothetical protein